MMTVSNCICVIIIASNIRERIYRVKEREGGGDDAPKQYQFTENHEPTSSSLRRIYRHTEWFIFHLPAAAEPVSPAE
ncbi:hypothetical protein EB796_010819 [Bugula neritina]|uniref:Uncharacterized protein n=1 Tax=Bugula neritina TaxID=10212 RepID=A0A7J7JZS4_BUGNE|nr:hypothetical protein EB796_010819 [Bugula neritina]